MSWVTLLSVAFLIAQGLSLGYAGYLIWHYYPHRVLRWLPLTATALYYVACKFYPPPNVRALHTPPTSPFYLSDTLRYGLLVLCISLSVALMGALVRRVYAYKAAP